MTNKCIQDLVAEIRSAISASDFLEIAEAKTEELKQFDEAGGSIESLLRLIEDNPEVDFGMPGPLVHFMERFYRKGYEVHLLASIRRKPVPHTLWMLNRVINGSTGKTKKGYISELDAVLRRNDISLQTKEVASEFRALHG